MLAILCGSLIDGTGSPTLKDAVILVRGSRISSVGKKNEIKIPANAKKIDASDKTVVPGLIDSHTHFLAMGYRLGFIQLDDAESITEISERVNEYIKNRELSKGQWAQGRGWDDQNLKEKRYPTRHDLDAVSPDNPVALTRICGHMIILNTCALKACGITKSIPNPPGGVVDKDSHGEPTGVLRDARSIVTPHIPPPSYEEVRQGLRNATTLAHSLGATTIHDCSRPDETDVLNSTAPYIDAHKEGDLKIRAHVMTWYPRRWEGDEWLTLGTLKIGIDGSMGAQTALLHEPYTNDPSTCGVYVGDHERNKAVVKEEHDMGGDSHPCHRRQSNQRSNQQDRGSC